MTGIVRRGPYGRPFQHNGDERQVFACLFVQYMSEYIGIRSIHFLVVSCCPCNRNGTAKA